MTKITFFKKKDLWLGFEVSGHTGKDDFGKDLLCCQISTVAQLALVGIDEVLKRKNFHAVSDGYLKISLDEKVAQDKEIQFLFETCRQSFKSIIQDEDKFAKMEVKNV
jgi:hypothetical protein